MNITKLSHEIHAINKEKGFWTPGEKKNVGELLMLVTSELGEALEAHRKNKFADSTWIAEMYETGHTPEDSPDYFKGHFESEIKDTFEDEIADAVIRLLDMSAGLGIDIEWHIEQKMAYNRTRPFKHGKQY